MFFNTDQNVAVGGGYSSGVINIIDINNGVVIKTITPFTNYVYSLNITSDSKYLVAGGYDGIIKIFIIADWSELLSTVYVDHVNKVMFSNDMNYLVSAHGAGYNAKVLILKQAQYK